MIIRHAWISALAVALILIAGRALAEPAQVNVSVGPRLEAQVDDLGRRDVERQTGRLAEVVRRELATRPEFDGARVDLVLSQLKPNRPTWEQTRRRPGLDPLRSVSVGGAEIEGEVTRADGATRQISSRYFSVRLVDVWGVGPWADAERAYRRAAAQIARNP